MATKRAYWHSKYENVAPTRSSVTGSNGGDGLKGQFGNLLEKKQKFWLDSGKNLIGATWKGYRLKSVALEGCKLFLNHIRRFVILIMAYKGNGLISEIPTFIQNSHFICYLK